VLAIKCITVISMIDVQKMVKCEWVEAKLASAAEAMLEQQQYTSV
jgi:hypothetical protein